MTNKTIVDEKQQLIENIISDLCNQQKHEMFVDISDVRWTLEKYLKNIKQTEEDVVEIKNNEWKKDERYCYRYLCKNCNKNNIYEWAIFCPECWKEINRID